MQVIDENETLRYTDRGLIEKREIEEEEEEIIE